MTERVLAGDCPLTPNSELDGGQAGGLANTSRGDVVEGWRAWLVELSKDLGETEEGFEALKIEGAWPSGIGPIILPT